MIKLESAHIEEVRGIRKLDIDFRSSTFAVSGPNGSGKSGVIDAIEFALTGQIGRLSGRGTKGLSVSEHGPHVDKARFPDAAFVRLKVHLTRLGKTASITRMFSAPKKPIIEPNDSDIVAALSEIAEHPEIALSRREILRFILVEPSKRSEEVQTLLKLDEIGQARSALNTAQNRLQGLHRTATAQVETSQQALQRHLGIATLRSADVLEQVNKRRSILGLGPIDQLTPDTRVDADLVTSTSKVADFNKESALRDVAALKETAGSLSTMAVAEVTEITNAMAELENDAALLVALQRHAFVETGLQLVDGAACPLCDILWQDEITLREHLKSKLEKSQRARAVQKTLLDNAGAIAAKVAQLLKAISTVATIAQLADDKACLTSLNDWKADLETFSRKLTDIAAIRGLKHRLLSGWASPPPSLAENVNALMEQIKARPDQSATVAAQTFLTTAQLRLGDYREAMRSSKSAAHAHSLAKTAYEAYCMVLEEELAKLYQAVQEDFSVFYRMINADDEGKFTAKFTPSEGKLDFGVNFYERGVFPPGAYHSEGHQDGMGVCLYLALMKRLFGDQFKFALLDDVVMSVDSDHRYQFCKLLKTHFPDTQFIITTHDRLWAEQMKSAGLVSGKTSLAFHSWNIDTGPLVESSTEIWGEIESQLARGRVETAAAALRHHLEYVSRHLADQLGASPQFRADGNYELGELLPPVLVRLRTLYGKAAEAAQSWGNEAQKRTSVERKEALSNSAGSMNVEQWAVNKAVHYNAWANFGRRDFEPVVKAFRELLACFQCDSCESWLYVTPRSNPDTLRCACNAINFNLKGRDK